MALASRVSWSLQNVNRSVFSVTQPQKLFVNRVHATKVSSRLYSDAVGVESSGDRSVKQGKRDPAPFFFHEEVQSCLLGMNLRETSKVFEPRREGQILKSPELKFLTQEELEKEQAMAQETAKYYLQMPPVLAPSDAQVEVLSKDPALQGLESSKYLFTDISYGVPHRERLIVARDPDGTLRHATRKERSQMIQTYFPTPGKFHETPSLFSGPQLQALLERSEFEFLLDLACLQFEPDDPEYTSLTSKIYEYIDDNNKYDVLVGTRHYGSLAFYLVFNGQFDKFLNYCICNKKIEDAVATARVFYLTRPDIKESPRPSAMDDTKFLQEYISNHAKEQAMLMKSLNAYLELNLPSTADLKAMKNQ